MSNPALTFRASPEARERLERLSAKTGKSFGQLLRESLGLTERVEQQTFDRGWAEGFEAGRKKGREETTFYYFCVFCRQRINLLPGCPEHQVVVDALIQRHWGHQKCHALA